VTLAADWSEQRETLRGLATHVLARARYQASGRFSLEPSPGGFATPTFATADDAYRRLRVATAPHPVLVDERVGPHGATAQYLPLDDTSLASLALELGIDLDADFSVGHDTPDLGDPHRPIQVDPSVLSTIGEWYALGAIAIDRSVTALTARAPGVARVWPEHFDLGTDVEVVPGRRCNLGASPGDDSHPEPYLYVGPFGGERPGPGGYWNASFGAVRGYVVIVGAGDPLRAATEFFHEGIRRLGA
jgi:hypothetical protein